MSEEKNTTRPAENQDNSNRQTEAKSRRQAFGILGLLILAVAIGGFIYWLHARSFESTDDAFVEGRVVIISPKVSGHVLKVYIADNQEVKVGDLIAEIDPRDFQARLDQAKAALLGARARYTSAEIGQELTQVTSTAGEKEATAAVRSAQVMTETARKRLEQVRAQIAGAEALIGQSRSEAAAMEAEAVRAKADVVRFHTLLAKDEVSRQQYDLALAVSNAASARLEAARNRIAATESQLREAEAAQATADNSVLEGESRVREAQARLTAAMTASQQIGISHSQKDNAAAQLEELRVAVCMAELQLSYTRIYAPESGRVTRKSVEEGAFVGTGQALLAIVPSQVWVVANFKETQLADMQPGQKVEIEADCYPGRTFRGHVDSIQNGTGSRFSLLPPENATGNYVKVVQRVPVKIVFDEVPETVRALSPGMSVIPRVRVK